MLEKRGDCTSTGGRRHSHTELASLSTFSITALWRRAGGGGDRLTPPAIRLALVLANYESQPLSQDLRVINKVSQNLHAETDVASAGPRKGNGGNR